MARSVSPALRALPLAALDFAAAAALYRFVSPELGVVLALVGVLVIASVAGALYRDLRRRGPTRY
ncbi:hypothetical protein [Halorientalis halophila]|uniref:hypothetical protein n=1 Tax=Halorientalis halophila TaxID=3108499 RepID=UPI00300B6102